MRPPRSLRARLLLANLVVAGAALGTVGVAVSLVGPGYFAEAMGHLPGDPMGELMDAATRAAFSDALRNALGAAGLIAIATAVVVSLALSAAIAGPVSGLAAAARRIAEGHYAERVPQGEGELGQVAGSFNAMASSLEATEHRRLELVGDVAHELRTPLSTLEGYLEGLEDGVIRPSAETWTLLRSEARRLTRLVDGLQELWRAEAQQLPLKLERIDAAEVARELVDRYGRQPNGHPVTMVAEPSADLIVRADRERLAQILGNFLSNAVRYSPAASPVVVSARRVGDAVELAVRDHGPGFTPEQRAHVFERFYRIDPSRSRALGGSGIGLAIARALAHAMGGGVRAESDGPGRGATFTIALPIALTRS